MSQPQAEKAGAPAARGAVKEADGKQNHPRKKPLTVLIIPVITGRFHRRTGWSTEALFERRALPHLWQTAFGIRHHPRQLALKEKREGEKKAHIKNEANISGHPRVQIQ